jgi:hypothetical protein
MTVGTLADMGYQVSYAMADAYVRPTSVVVSAFSTISGSTLPQFNGMAAMVASRSENSMIAGSADAAAGANLNRLGMQMGATRFPVQSPSLRSAVANPPLIAARSAVFDAFSALSSTNEIDRGESNQAAIDVAWSELPSSVLDALFA